MRFMLLFITLVIPLLEGALTGTAYAETLVRVDLREGEPVKVAIAFSREVRDPVFPTWVYGYYETFEAINRPRVLAQTGRGIEYEMDFREAVPSVVSGGREPHRYYLYGRSLFPTMQDPELYPVVVTIQVDEGLPILSNFPGADKGVFTFGSRRELLDSVFWIGSFRRHEVDLCGRKLGLIFTEAPGDLSAFAHKVCTVLQFQVQLFDGDFHRDYLFFFHTVQRKEDAYQAQEYADSSVIQVPAGEMNQPTVMLYEMIAHEFFHRWNIGRMAPEGYWREGPSQEMPSTREMWFFEGVTKYYELLSVYRAGLIGEEELYDSLSQMVRKASTEGRSSSVLEAGAKAYADGRSYYRATTEGACLAFLADVRIHSATGGRKSFDDVVRTLYRKHGKTGIPYTHEAILKTVAEVSGLEMSDWFDGKAAVMTMAFINETVSSIGLELRFPMESFSYGLTSPSGGISEEPSARLLNKPAVSDKERSNRERFLFHKLYSLNVDPPVS